MNWLTLKYKEKAFKNKNKHMPLCHRYKPIPLIASYIVISYARTGYVSMPGLISFSCFVTYGRFVLINLLK